MSKSKMLTRTHVTTAKAVLSRIKKMKMIEYECAKLKSLKLEATMMMKKTTCPVMKKP